MNVGVTPSRRQLALAVVAALAAAVGSNGPAVATLLLAAGTGRESRGMAGLVGWIGGGALVGGGIGYAVEAVVEFPLSTAGAVGLGIALGGGLGGISHLLSTDEPASIDDERMTVDMTSQSAPEPRPADLFEEHPDPILYVTDSGGGPVVRAANDAYERAFDLPATTIENAPLGDVLVTAADADDLPDTVAAGESVDEVREFETPEGIRRYRVRSVAATDDGYLVFTPLEG